MTFKCDEAVAQALGAVGNWFAAAITPIWRIVCMIFVLFVGITSE
jgi:hypothetical protein